jgi:proliferating cell nuclear antigen
MFEARLIQGSVLKRIIDAIKDLVTDCNIDCNDTGIALEAMDGSHVALVSLHLRSEAFDPYRCDRSITLGVNLPNLGKFLRAAGNDDIITLQASDTDELTLQFESEKHDKISEYALKLINVDVERMQIPDQVYNATVTMPSAEFQRICRDLAAISESVTISATKDGVRFVAKGQIGNGSVVLRPTAAADNPKEAVFVDIQNPSSMSFALNFLQMITKATPLSDQVTLNMTDDLPMLIEYKFDEVGFMNYYLAPKIGDE